MKKMLLVVVIVLVTLSAALFYVDRTKQPNQGGSVIDLIRPPFVSQAQAADLAAYLDQEAGISAWYKATTISLSGAKTACRADNVLEIDTADYFICSVPISGYLDRYYPHVFVHKDGWIMAFYFVADPTSKMFDVLSGSLNTTLLKIAVSTVASAGGASFSDVSYYDFRYPMATNLLMLKEDEASLNYFTIEMPTSYSYFERSWAFYKCYYFSIYLNGVNIASPVYNSNDMCYGTISASQLQPGVTNNFEINGGTTPANGFVIITYGVP